MSAAVGEHGTVPADPFGGVFTLGTDATAFAFGGEELSVSVPRQEARCCRSGLIWWCE